eukprot:TRINITY_DN15267_c0_g7_i1.p1 TRINITY_DN15267_c0_g7~~TRINITY_DN15267_c0_g7_i1.p1  ORF type:complete len:116 (-),score=1.39 TRINITY_DN15267_c0_g7_i1:32-379(-)
MRLRITSSRFEMPSLFLVVFNTFPSSNPFFTLASSPNLTSKSFIFSLYLLSLLRLHINLHLIYLFLFVFEEGEELLVGVGDICRLLWLFGHVFDGVFKLLLNCLESFFVWCISAA